MATDTTPRSVDACVASLPADRREAVSQVREVVRRNLPAGFEEGIQSRAAGGGG